MLVRRTRVRGRHRRAAEYVEFAILLPFFVFFITFAVDMGRLTMLQSAVQDATQQVARAGAQSGGWDFISGTYCSAGTGVCAPNSAPYKLMQSTLNQIPFANGSYVKSVSSYASDYGTTYAGPFCVNNTGSYIVAKSQYDARYVFLTPGLYALMGAALGSHWYLNATAVARADVCH